MTPEQLKAIVSERLKTLHAEDYEGEPLADFARRLTVPERALRRWLKGTNTITVCQLAKISKASGASMNWLIGRGEEDE